LLADDARLVVLNARDAADMDAVIAPSTRCVSGKREGGLWSLTLKDERAGRLSESRRTRW
jgi:glycerol-3-phosphate dehydrogenase